MFSWGVRMTIAVIVPLALGIYFGRLDLVMWVIVASETIGWVELKGSFAQRVRMLLVGAFLSVFFGFAGTIVAPSIVLSTLLMALVAFLAVLFKNLGERGSGLSLVVYVMYIIPNAHPVADPEELQQRCMLIAAGGLWSFLVGVVASLFISEHTPYKRSVAVIWKPTAALAGVISRGWDGIGARAGLREIYQKVKEVNAAIDSSLQLYDKRAYQANHDDATAERMAQMRKSVYLTGATLMAVAEELESIQISSLKGTYREAVHVLLKSVEMICERMAIYTVTAKPEEEILIRSRIIRVQNMIAILREADMGMPQQKHIRKLVHLGERMVKLLENVMSHIQVVFGEDKKVFRSYSLMKTLLILHHKHWVGNIRRLASVNTHSFRFALRTAIVASIAFWISRYFPIPHGYWLPFTVMIIVQPYFGATIKRAFDRVLGTISGVVLGGFLLALQPYWHIKEVLLVISPIFMVYFLRKRYSLATFFISLFLVALFAAENSLDQHVILTRALCTVGGAALAIIGEFSLLPSWEKDWLPRYVGEAIEANFNYFLFSFFPNYYTDAHQWTYYRNIAESKNSNVFDSLNRYLQEPSMKGKDYTTLYQLISHCIRVTRELNNYHLEFDPQEKDVDKETLQVMRMAIKDGLEKFLLLRSGLESLNIVVEKKADLPEDLQLQQYIPFNANQTIYMDKLSVELNAFVRDMDEWVRKQKQSV